MCGIIESYKLLRQEKPKRSLSMEADVMRIADASSDLISDEQDIYESLLPAQAKILELGCGTADKTRRIAQIGKVASILALEVDEIQHAKNKAVTDLPNVLFELGAAEDIPASDASVDIVMMFKSLHHVPLDKLDQAFSEIHRVLKPGGLAYISEPVFAGDYNEIMRLFHDEQRVREAAFDAVKRVVASGRLALVKQIFFKTRIRFRDFAQFEERVLKVTHTNHKLSAELYEEVRTKFSKYMKEKGAEFYVPIRVDLLRKAD
jgi:ubiquinone/menaquinone biosynthesis C-methylase UbiE